MRALILLISASALLAQAQTPAAAPPKPIFTRESLVPLQGNRAKLLAPGMVVELYGQHLAPEPWCGEKNMPPPPYPVEVCGVRVLVGTRPAGLLFVGPAQINFKIPVDAPAEGSAPIQVCIRGVCSAPVTMQFSTRKAFVRLQGTAAVHMPVWVEIDEPAPNEIRYPCQVSPWSFDDYRFEVRRNGLALSPLPAPRTAGIGIGGCWGEASPSRLPLHLLYNFDQPGVYSVRFTGVRRESGQTICQSDWTDIKVEAFSEERRNESLRSLTEKAKTASTQDVVGYIVPSLLAWPDEKALAALVSLLPATPPPCPGAACDVQAFKVAALAAFDDALLRRAVAPDRLARLCPPEGRCRAGR